MKRRGFLSMLAIALLAIASMIGASQSASAQIVACAAGTYKVDLTNLPPVACYPLTITTSWAGGRWVLTKNYPGPGVWFENPGAPVGAPLDWIVICGTIIPPVPGQTTVICPNCTLCVRVCTDVMGCLVIKVFFGPCPAPLLPCP